MKNRNTSIIVALAAAFSIPAFAGGSDGHDDGTTRPGQTWAAASQGQEQFSTQRTVVKSAIDNAVQAISGPSNATGGQGVGNVNVAAPTIPDPAAAPAIAPALSVSSLTCMGTMSGGFSLKLFSMSGGKTYIDPECERRQNILMLQTLQRPGAAIRLACTQPDMRKALGAECD